MVYSAPTWVRRACGGVRLKPIEVQTKPDSSRYVVGGRTQKTPLQPRAEEARRPGQEASPGLAQVAVAALCAEVGVKPERTLRVTVAVINSSARAGLIPTKAHRSLGIRR
jgi:hypothetical protein